ncbi:glycoside hydrolase family 127 protein [Georgenia sp. TF02-10]|uniref:beta-L-arabinofuranosidase domain-containing protein n=1 Tax=Georgenia sp. TF02-10 TaxID=2917725 RepID=UPI001FA7CDE6|nr:beta-L-arabinofuranosidase domain-containing protein [Georgenia sp. TF02-10]UNX55516.1 glycoside hydrolase family 127 protein [Georgenia sp. TF02-10]
MTGSATPSTVRAANEADLLADVAEIYLGNLATVETDLTLPPRGSRGTRFTWRSGEPLFLSHAGRVTRPSPGVGNRVVPLHLTATLDGAIVQRAWEVTILEEELVLAVAEVIPVRVTLVGDEVLRLPAFAVVRLEDGRTTVRAVAWGEPEPVPGGLRARGTVEGTDLPAVSTVVRLHADPTQAELTRRRVTRQVTTGAAARLTGRGRLPAAARDVVAHLHEVDVDRLLHGFRAAAGLDTRGTEPMTGWDSPDSLLRGHTTGHYLSALALAWRSTGDPELADKVTALVRGLAECQDALGCSGHGEGFLSSYSEEQFDLLEELTTYPTIWAPYYTLDKIMSGLLDAYEMAGNAEALAVCARVGTWVGRRLSRVPVQRRDAMWSIYIAGEYGAMISTLVRLHRLTGDEGPLRAARYFSNDKLFEPLQQGYDTLDGMHANQHIPQVMGALDLFTYGRENRHWATAERFWELVTEHHTVPVGGTGETEMFRAPDAVAASLTDKSAETCATYNMMKLSAALFRSAPDARYMDYYEHALANHVAATFSGRPDGGSTYFLPLSPGATRSFDTDENTCCHGTGLENPFRFQEDVVTVRDERTWYLNLYVPAELEDRRTGVRFELVRRGAGRWTLVAREASNVELRLRRPGYATVFTVRRRGETVGVAPGPDGYLVVPGPWSPADELDIEIEVATRVRRCPDDPQLFWLQHGPHVLAAVHPRKTVLPLPAERARATVAARPWAEAWEVDGVRLVPVAEVGDHAYHVVMRDGEEVQGVATQ